MSNDYSGNSYFKGNWNLGAVVSYSDDLPAIPTSMEATYSTDCMDKTISVI